MKNLSFECKCIIQLRSFSLFNDLIRILSNVSHIFGPTNLFIGLKWNGYSWIDLSSGQLVKREIIPWCAGNPQGKSFSLSDSFFIESVIKLVDPY